MFLAAFEPTISAGEWPQTYALDRAATSVNTDVKFFGTATESVYLEKTT
jgi:hypothetical protein